MTLNARKVNNNGPKQDPVDAGTYPARTVQILDMGLQAQRAFEGQEKPPANEIMITYELVDEFMKDDKGEDILDKPRWISETIPLYSLNSDRAKSTQRYMVLDPKLDHDGDWSQLLDIPVNVTLINKPGKQDKIYTNVTSISAVRPRDAQKFPALVNDAKFFDMDNPDVELFLTLPDWVQKKVKDGLEFGGSKLEALLKKHGGKKEDKKPEPKQEDDDIPFDEEEGQENW